MDLAIYGARICRCSDGWLRSHSSRPAHLSSPSHLTHLSPPTPLHGSGFDFTRTLRVDYLHAGGPKGETITLDAVVSEGEWAGSRTQLIDTTNLGKYIFEVIDRSSNRVIYSRGFATIYGEWETTPEFRTRDRTFHESLRFPQPNVPVRVVIKKRDLRNVFQPLWEIEVDPRAAIAASLPLAVVEHLDCVRKRPTEP